VAATWAPSLLDLRPRTLPAARGVFAVGDVRSGSVKRVGLPLHVFGVTKCQFGYRKVRYRGIAKNRAREFSPLALANQSVPGPLQACVRMTPAGAKRPHVRPSR
jgi:hypothetical protein